MSDGEATPIDPQPDDRLYTPVPNEAQLTARAVIVGCLIGSVVSCTNIYIGSPRVAEHSLSSDLGDMELQALFGTLSLISDRATRRSVARTKSHLFLGRTRALCSIEWLGVWGRHGLQDGTARLDTLARSGADGERGTYGRRFFLEIIPQNTQIL